MRSRREKRSRRKAARRRVASSRKGLQRREARAEPRERARIMKSHQSSTVLTKNSVQATGDTPNVKK